MLHISQYQGGRQKFEIDVAYNLGQKGINHDIFGIEGQMAISPDGQMSGQPDV